MGVKQRIKFKDKIYHKNSTDDNTQVEDILPEDTPRFEEHSDEEYQDHCKKFFKGKEDDADK